MVNSHDFQLVMHSKNESKGHTLNFVSTFHDNSSQACEKHQIDSWVYGTMTVDQGSQDMQKFAQGSLCSCSLAQHKFKVKVRQLVTCYSSLVTSADPSIPTNEIHTSKYKKPIPAFPTR